MTTVLTLRQEGPFSLAEAARFWSHFPAGAEQSPHSLELAWCVDGSWEPVAARVTEHDGAPAVTVGADPAGASSRVGPELERILSLDVDATGFPEVARRDPIAGDLLARYPGLRPVLFPTPYEAAAWAVIGQRIQMSQAAALRRRLAERHGTALTVGEHTRHVFPGPGQLARLTSFPGLPAVKVERLRALAEAALAGYLNAGELRRLLPAEALDRLQRLPGIGPFSAELVFVRGAGHPDVFPTREKRLHRAMAGAYGLGPDPPLDRLERIAEAWRPWRSWVALLLRQWLEEPEDVSRGLSRL